MNPLPTWIAALLLTACAEAEPADTSDPGGAEDAPFTLTSAWFVDGGTLPIDASCDGAGVSPPLAWTAPPAETAGFALLMTTEALDGTRWNWVLYGIPAAATGLPEGGGGIGTNGLTSDGPELEYHAPCSQGPGAKLYTFTLYAVSGVPMLDVPAEEVTGPVLTAALAEITLDTAALSASYTRVEGAE